MKVQLGNRTVHLTYSTNVHPSENFVQIYQALKTYVLPLKARLAPDREFGLGLYLPYSVVQEFYENEYRRWEFDEFLRVHGLYLFSLNCFPFGNFHGERVKEKVFEPDWTKAERLDYTKKAADLLARWLPEGVVGSISTHTGGYGRQLNNDPRTGKIAENLAKAALYLSRLESKTGKRIVLSPEPEPFAFAGNMAQYLSFYREHVLVEGRAYLEKTWSMNSSDAEALLRRHLGVCLDTCHASAQHETPERALDLLQASPSGQQSIIIGKVQLSAALELKNPFSNRKAFDRFCRFAEPRYFHQTSLKSKDSQQEFPDLVPQELEPLFISGEREAISMRTHFHVPIFWGGDAELTTTRHELELAFPMLLGSCDSFEIETYTWDVIPVPERARVAPDLVSSIEQEYRWVLEQMKKSV